MSSILNGLSLSKVRPYGSGFLIFSDYARGAIRLSAIMEIPTIHIFTHDSIGVGEDGPTHQPVEQLASLRAIPNLIVFRPGDANEVAEAWRTIMKLKHEPACLILSRQPLPTLDRAKYASAENTRLGGYILANNVGPDGQLDVILLGTGSEISLCVGAFEKLAAEGVKARVVSLPSWELFEHQPQEYKDQVLPPGVKARVAVEQAGRFGWQRYVSNTEAIIGMKTFGASAPLKELTKKFGFTVDAVVETAKQEIKRVSADAA
jgi:transketolase